MMKIKNHLLLLLIVGQSFAALAQDDKTPYETRSLANDAIKSVSVETSGGSILVSGAAGVAPRIEVYVHGNNNQELSKDDIKKRLDEDYKLEVSVSGNEVLAVAKRKHDGFNWNWKKQLSISFKIYVPNKIDTRLETSGGSIHLDNLSGDEKFSTSGGSLHVDHLTGMIKGETSGGSIEVSNSGNDINLQTSGGSVHASNCRGKIKLETSGGSLNLESLNGTINANTSGGSIKGNNIEGELITGTSGGSINLSRLSCSLEASTSGGGMDIEIVHAGKYVKLDDSGGHITLKLPSKQGLDLNLSADHIDKPSNTYGFNGEWNKDHVKGSINGGGIPVNVGVNGHLDVSFD